MNVPATITPAMISCIAEMQSGNMVQYYIESLEETIDMVLDQGDVTDLECANATTYLHRVKDLRELSKHLKTFLVSWEDAIKLIDEKQQ